MIIDDNKSDNILKQDQTSVKQDNQLHEWSGDSGILLWGLPWMAHPTGHLTKRKRSVTNGLASLSGGRTSIDRTNPMELRVVGYWSSPSPGRFVAKNMAWQTNLDHMGQAPRRNKTS